MQTVTFKSSPDRQAIEAPLRDYFARFGVLFAACLGVLCGVGFVPNMRRNTSSSDGVGGGVGLLIGELL